MFLLILFACTETKETGIDNPVRTLNSTIVLGDGGFFGISGQQWKDSFAVGAHYANLDNGIPAGRVYTFDKIPSTIDDATLIYEAPDGAENAGFGWNIGQECDVNADDFTDIPIGSHLYSPSMELGAAGRIIVFSDTITNHTLDPSIQASADVIGQTVLCADLNNDGFDDLLSTGQNAGSSNTGIAAIWFGGENGLGQYQDQIIEPPILESKQYLGSVSIWDDFNLDGSKELLLGGWGLIDKSGTHSGGVIIYDTSFEPSIELYPGSGIADKNVGVTADLLKEAGYLAIGSTDSVYIYTLGDLSQDPIELSAPIADVAFGNSLRFVKDYSGKDEWALLVGMKYADLEDKAGAGLVAVYQDFSIEPTIISSPMTTSGDSFGGNISRIGDINKDGLEDFFIGIEAHLEGDIYTGTQTGGIVLYY